MVDVTAHAEPSQHMISASTCPVTTRLAASTDLAAIADLNAKVFGPGRFARSAYRIREGKGLMSKYCRVADRDGQLIASLRLTETGIGGEFGAALLGPLAVHPDFTGQGYGRKLVAEAIADMRAAGIKLVVLVGDEPYYGRFGFKRAPAGQLVFPGPVNPHRILALELQEGALQAYRGAISATVPPGVSGNS